MTRWPWILATGALLAAGAWAQEKKQAQDVEGQIKAACLRYYAGTLFGSAPEFFAVTRTPLIVVRDGVLKQRTESESKELLASIAEQIKSRNLGEEDRKLITGNIIAMLDDAPVQYVGANTAEITILLHKGKKPDEGDNLGTLVLYRSGGQWKVIEEVTDTAPVPPAYLVEEPKK